MSEIKDEKRMWGLDEKLEKNICFVFKAHKEDIQKARYTGISSKGNLKFEIGRENFVFDPAGNLISGPYGKMKIATKTFFLDCQKYKEALETALYAKDSFFRRIEVGSPTKVVPIMLYFQSCVYEEMEYPVCIEINVKKYIKKESEEEFIKYILDEISKVKKQCQQWYDRQLTKCLSEVIVYEDSEKEYCVHPKKDAYIYLKKNRVKIKCAVQAESCFTRVSKHKGCFVEEYTYEPICFYEIKKRMDEKICRNKLMLPKDILRLIKEFLVNNKPWMNKLMDSTAVWIGRNNDSENIEKKCRIKGNDFSIIYIGSNLIFAKGEVHFENGADRAFSQKRFRAIFKEASELMTSYRYISGAGVLRGDTVVEKMIGLSVVQDTIHVPDYKKSIPAWRKQLKSELKRIEKAAEEKLEKECKKIEEKSFPIDYLTRDILRVSMANEYGLSKTTFCAILRGLTVRYGVRYSKPSGIGNYNLISKEEVENRLIQLLSVKLLKTRKVNTAYYSYENIVPTAEGECFFHSMEKKKAWKSNETEKKYKRYIERKSETKYILKILDLIFEDKAFFCFHQQDILTELRDCTEECKTLLKMKKKVERDRYKKKIYTEILR